MRIIIVALAFAIISGLAVADEVTTDLDRCVVLNDQTNQTAESKISMYFGMPAVLADKEIMFAGIEFDLNVQTTQDTALFELKGYGILNDWTSSTIAYNSDCDSFCIASFTIKPGFTNSFNIDITEFVKDVIDSTRTNYGLMFEADLLGDNSIRLSPMVGNAIMNLATIRFKYK